MRIAYVQSYPIYHDLWTTEQWLALQNRDRWMPAITAALGHEVELWGIDRPDRHPGTFETQSEMPGFAPYTIRLFPASIQGKRTKFDYSDDLNAFAGRFAPDLVIIKGTDGGAGTCLIDRVLRPRGIPFAFVIGGKYYTRHVPQAAYVFYETERQREALAHPGAQVWRRAVAPERLGRLNKSIDTSVFRPIPEVEKQYDVISVGRLVPRNKRYDALGVLSEQCRVAVVGGGPEAERLKARYPRVDWLGKQPNHLLPELLNRARLFLHAGLRDHYPRVLAEAAACGLPSIAFAEAIDPDVLPAAIGLRVSREQYQEPILALLNDPARLRAMAAAARAYAVASTSVDSSRPALEKMFDTLLCPAQ